MATVQIISVKLPDMTYLNKGILSTSCLRRKYLDCRDKISMQNEVKEKMSEIGAMINFYRQNLS